MAEHDNRQNWFRKLLPYGAAVVAGFLLFGLAGPRLLSRSDNLQRKPIPFVEMNGTAGSPERVAADVSPVVVGIVSKVMAQEWLGDRSQMAEEQSGTGVIFDQRGYIFTNNHVVEGGRDLLVSLSDGRKVPGKVVGTDRLTDLAVVKIYAGKTLPVAVLGDSDQLRVGQTAIAIGNPIGMEFQRTVTVGVISGLNRVLQIGERMFRLIQTDATINPGNSGGPLLNSQGQVVGINTVKIDMPEVEGMGFAIPINSARPIITTLMNEGKISRPWLGLALVGKAEAEQYGIKIPEGMMVVRVIPGSPAADTGIQEGDLILQVDGQAVDRVDGLSKQLVGKKVGDLVNLIGTRNNQQFKAIVRLGETP